MGYYKVTIAVVTEDDRGNHKKSNESILVDSLSVEEAVKKTHKDFEDYSSSYVDWRVSKVEELKVSRLI